MHSKPPARLTISSVRLRVTTLLAVAASIAYVCRTSLAVAEKTIRLDLNISEETMGLLLGPAFFWPYALAQVPAGWLGERLGARRNLPLVATAWSLASAAFGVAQGAAMLIVARVTGGLAQAGLLPCAAGTVSRWHPPTERALASGALGAAMSIGAAGGAAMTGELLQLLSWRAIFVLYALPGVIWSMVFYAWFRNQPEEHPAMAAAELERITGSPKDKPPPDKLERPRSAPRFGNLRFQANLLLICGQQFFRAAAYAFFSSWFATYLQETRNVSTAASGWLLTVPLLATVAGSLAGGAVSDSLLRWTGSLWIARSLLATLALAICGNLVFAAWFVVDATLATALIGAGAFFAALAGPCAYATTMDLGGKQVTMVFSIMNMIGNFGAGLAPWLVPQFRRLIEDSTRLLELSQGNSWNAVLLLFGVMYLWGACCWIGVKPPAAATAHS